MPPADRAPPRFAASRVAKAEQFLRSAAAALGRTDWDAAVKDAVLAGIAAGDSFLAGRHGIRNVGRHDEMVQLLRKHGGPDVASRSEQIARLLAVKSDSQYGERMFGAKQAGECVARAERLVEWAKKALKGEKR